MGEAQLLLVVGLRVGAMLAAAAAIQQQTRSMEGQTVKADVSVRVHMGLVAVSTPAQPMGRPTRRALRALMVSPGVGAGATR